MRTPHLIQYFQLSQWCLEWRGSIVVSLCVCHGYQLFDKEFWDWKPATAPIHPIPHPYQHRLSHFCNRHNISLIQLIQSKWLGHLLFGHSAILEYFNVAIINCSSAYVSATFCGHHTIHKRMHKLIIIGEWSSIGVWSNRSTVRIPGQWTLRMPSGTLPGQR